MPFALNINASSYFSGSPPPELVLLDEISTVADFLLDNDDWTSAEFELETPIVYSRTSVLSRRTSIEFAIQPNNGLFLLLDLSRKDNGKRQQVMESPTSAKICMESSVERDSKAAPIKKGSSPYAFTGTSGENRLRVNFICHGVFGPRPQRFGTSGCCIPNGLKGEHCMYEQSWRFEVLYDAGSARDGEAIQITWRITNLKSRLVVEQRETPQQAKLREYSGRTICNKVVKTALTARAEELENVALLEQEGFVKDAILNSIRALRPRLCTVGLLFFGLLHEAVQGR